MSISEYMMAEHRRCDELFAKGEELLLDDKLAEAAPVLTEFREAMLHHFQLEENILFPAFETATGMTQGPTTVMRMEHEQMRGALEQVQTSLDAADANSLEGTLETLLILMQQHNAKEEQILYPGSDQAIPDAEALAEKLAAS